MTYCVRLFALALLAFSSADSKEFNKPFIVAAFICGLLLGVKDWLEGKDQQ